MSGIKKDEVEHLAKLARIELTSKERDKLAHEFGAILEYVDQLGEIAAKSENGKKVDVHHNVLREDSEPHEPGIYTDALLGAAPKREGQYVRVKKILKDGG